MVPVPSPATATLPSTRTSSAAVLSAAWITRNDPVEEGGSVPGSFEEQATSAAPQIDQRTKLIAGIILLLSLESLSCLLYRGRFLPRAVPLRPCDGRCGHVISIPA